MNVISIDAAPSNPAAICDGRYSRVSAAELPDYCRTLAERGDVLLLWDAPLTGPPPEPRHGPRSPYYQRCTERFFHRQTGVIPVPVGISVLPFAGCSHWAVTRASLGLPVCGRYGQPLDSLPFRLTTDAAQITRGGPRVVESHPALAAWLWLRRADDPPDIDWTYKGSTLSKSKRTFAVADLWGRLRTRWADDLTPAVAAQAAALPEPGDDDEFDAAVGYVLGFALAAGDAAVDILGDAATGSFALPCDDALRRKFEHFAAGERPAP